MAGLPHLPLFVGDFFAGTTSWTGEEKGLYALCLFMQWSEKALPNDVRMIRKALNYDRTSFARHWPRVSTKFVDFEGMLINKRLEEHRSKALEIQRRNAERASRAASTRWNAPSNAPSIQKPMLQASKRDAPSMSGEHAIQSSLKNKIKRPVDMCITPTPKESERSDARPEPLAARNAPSIDDQGAAHRAWVLMIASNGKIFGPASAQAIAFAGLTVHDCLTADGAVFEGYRARFIAAYG